MNILKESVVEFDVKQITPMIHFQGEEDGAGIRASDLKPRFDAFLQRYLYDCKFGKEKEETEQCILGQEQRKNNNLESKQSKSEKISFAYKVKIINSDKDNTMTFYKGKNGKCKNIFYGSFYGSLADGKVSFYNKIKILFISPHKYLREQIKKYFPVFLAVNGFGLRNNKGYGYFKLEKKTENEIIEDIREYYELENDCVNITRERGVGIYQLKLKTECKPGSVLEQIKIFHQFVKSGYNYGDTYIPSFMLKGADIPNDISHEKKVMKQFLKNKGYDISNLIYRKLKGDAKEKVYREYPADKKNRYYIRGLLGMAPFYKFRLAPCRVVKFNVKIEDKNSIGKDKVSIERFASPISYLPISYNKIILLVDYSKIEKLRQSASDVVFSLNGTSDTVDMVIPTEEQYSIHKLFQKNGIIQRELEKNKSNDWRFEYTVICDVENRGGTDE